MQQIKLASLYNSNNHHNKWCKRGWIYTRKSSFYSIEKKWQWLSVINEIDVQQLIVSNKICLAGMVATNPVLSRTDLHSTNQKTPITVSPSPSVPVRKNGSSTVSQSLLPSVFHNNKSHALIPFSTTTSVVSVANSTIMSKSIQPASMSPYPPVIVSSSVAPSPTQKPSKCCVCLFVNTCGRGSKLWLSL